MTNQIGIILGPTSSDCYRLSFDNGRVHADFTKNDFTKIGELAIIEEFLTCGDSFLQKEGLRRVKLEK